MKNFAAPNNESNVRNSIRIASENFVVASRNAAAYVDLHQDGVKQICIKAEMAFMKEVIAVCLQKQHTIKSKSIAFVNYPFSCALKITEQKVFAKC